MAEQPPPQGVATGAGEKQGNAMGVAGFVLSLVGLLLTCGFLSPIGLILSALGMKKEPKGLAVAGLVLGIVGTLLLLFYGFGVVMVFLGLKEEVEKAGGLETIREGLREQLESSATGPVSMLQPLKAYVGTWFA